MVQVMKIQSIPFRRCSCVSLPSLSIEGWQTFSWSVHWVLRTNRMVSARPPSNTTFGQRRSLQIKTLNIW